MENMELKKFNVTDAVIASFKKDFLCLKINGLDDKEGYEKVKAARMTVKSKRVEVEKVRKELKEESLKFGRAVDGEAKRITAELEPIEFYLQSEQDKIDAEKERIKEEAKRKAQEKFDIRNKQLVQYGVSLDYMTLFLMEDDAFEAQLAAARVAFETEQKRLADIEKEKAAEAERLAKIAEEQRQERLKLEQLKAEQDAREAKMKAERDALEAEKRAIEAAKIEEENKKKRQAELEIAKQQAAEKARIETESRIKREAEEKAEAERLAKIEEAELAALMPDKEKLMAFADVIDALQFPVVASGEAISCLSALRGRLSVITAELRTSAKKLRKVKKV